MYTSKTKCRKVIKVLLLKDPVSYYYTKEILLSNLVKLVISQTKE
ncbi:MAG: hypothetical protein KatS3mg084_0402 [Candidatus Dojkabacteria bacterium]|nr:MAG: hypothetical protein KatS3mg084_0402 [Candidatus Dojkabacteria bacterium]